MTDDHLVNAIAIVGLSGQFPGDADSPEKLWQLIFEGHSAHGHVPPDRFNVDHFYDPDPRRVDAVSGRPVNFPRS